jgi:hypothetical protein
VLVSIASDEDGVGNEVGSGSCASAPSDLVVVAGRGGCEDGLLGFASIAETETSGMIGHGIAASSKVWPLRHVSAIKH